MPIRKKIKYGGNIFDDIKDSFSPPPSVEPVEPTEEEDPPVSTGGRRRRRRVPAEPLAA